MGTGTWSPREPEVGVRATERREVADAVEGFYR